MTDTLGTSNYCLPPLQLHQTLWCLARADPIDPAVVWTADMAPDARR